jgi:hypothetical protein
VTDKPTQLYRHFDADGALLYVGISLSAIARLKDHGGSSVWASQIASMTTEWHPSRETALAAEAKAIIDEGPRHNKAGRVAPKPQRKRTYRLFKVTNEIAAALDRLQQNYPDDPDIGLITAALKSCPENGFDKTAYMREYMRKLRASAKNAPPPQIPC